MEASPELLPGSVEAWALSYIQSTDLGYKCAPPDAPKMFSSSSPYGPVHPGRPPELRVTKKKSRNFGIGALGRLEVRAALHHKFWHHELQAAELMCWALLQFCDTPPEFKRGLIRIFFDEVRHMKLYEEHIEKLGYRLQDFEVRDWFWERVPTCKTATQFVALMGMGMEGANLEHTERFAGVFRSLGDEEAARIQEQVGLEEIAHVRFANHWFRRWTGDVNFDAWCKALPPPLSPLTLKGKNLHLDRRRKADFPDAFLERLALWQPDE